MLEGIFFWAFLLGAVIFGTLGYQAGSFFSYYHCTRNQKTFTSPTYKYSYHNNVFYMIDKAFNPSEFKDVRYLEIKQLNKNYEDQLKSIEGNTKSYKIIKKTPKPIQKRKYVNTRRNVKTSQKRDQESIKSLQKNPKSHKIITEKHILIKSNIKPSQGNVKLPQKTPKPIQKRKYVNTRRNVKTSQKRDQESIKSLQKNPKSHKIITEKHILIKSNIKPSQGNVKLPQKTPKPINKSTKMPIGIF